MLSALRNARGSDPVLGPPLTSHCGRRPACCQVGSEGMVASTSLTVNTVRFGRDHTTEILATPTEIQRRAFDLLALEPAP